MSEILIKIAGEHIPGLVSNISLNRLKEFATVPYHIEWYKSDSSNKVFPLFLQEIADLNPSKKIIPGLLGRNPFFDHSQIRYFIAYKDGIPAGRIAAFIDYNYNRQHNTDTGWFGLFESVQDSDVSNRLLESAVCYLIDNRCKNVLGPAKFNASGEVGLLVDGFDKKPFFMEPYNAPYYMAQLTDYGFRKENDWYSVFTDISSMGPYIDKIKKLEQRTDGTRRSISDNNGYLIRNIDFSDLKNEIDIIRELYNHIWNKGNHPQQSELTDSEFRSIAKGIKAISLEELIFISERDSEPVGVAVNIPDINEVITEYDIEHPCMPSNRIFNIRDLKRDLGIFNLVQKRLEKRSFKGIRMFILGVRENTRRSSLDSKLYYKTFEAATRIGVVQGSASQLADINRDILNPTLRMGKKSLTWRVYSLDI